MIDSALAQAWSPSPNHEERRCGYHPSLIILHYTGMPSAHQAKGWLCHPDSKVSCHYFIDEMGKIDQLVAEDRRAWHAGASCWKGEKDINSCSIGLEIAHCGHQDDETMLPYPKVQMEAVMALCTDIMMRHNIARHNVLAHSDIAPERKMDPGEAFPWAEFAAMGIGHWVEAEPLGNGRFMQEGDMGEPVEALQAMLALYGYCVDINATSDVLTAIVIRAFQRHFRPARVDGIADQSTIITLNRLLQTLP